MQIELQRVEKLWFTFIHVLSFYPTTSCCNSLRIHLRKRHIRGGNETCRICQPIFNRFWVQTLSLLPSVIYLPLAGKHMLCVNPMSLNMLEKLICKQEDKMRNMIKFKNGVIFILILIRNSVCTHLSLQWLDFIQRGGRLNIKHFLEVPSVMLMISFILRQQICTHVHAHTHTHTGTQQQGRDTLPQVCWCRWRTQGGCEWQQPVECCFYSSRGKLSNLLPQQSAACSPWSYNNDRNFLLFMKVVSLHPLPKFFKTANLLRVQTLYTPSLHLTYDQTLLSSVQIHGKHCFLLILPLFPAHRLLGPKPYFPNQSI